MRAIYFIIGLVAMILGAIGVFLPVLPTTPFLLLATACFAKSSTRFHNWFTNTKLYKNNLESFVKERSMTKQSKIKLLTLASTMLIIAMLCFDNLHFRIFIIALMMFKYYYFIFRIKTIA